MSTVSGAVKRSIGSQRGGLDQTAGGSRKRTWLLSVNDRAEEQPPHKLTGTTWQLWLLVLTGPDREVVILYTIRRDAASAVW